MFPVTKIMTLQTHVADPILLKEESMTFFLKIFCLHIIQHLHSEKVMVDA
jgi:hypothetical protein